MHHHVGASRGLKNELKIVNVRLSAIEAKLVSAELVDDAKAEAANYFNYEIKGSCYEVVTPV